tara:strand:+ start:840 stop:1013 length:174 start_codon:yes stop_codon:yes gene_type:complete
MNELLTKIRDINKLGPFPLQRISRDVNTGEYKYAPPSIESLRRCLMQQIRMTKKNIK